jgi:hypothetical protein
MPENLNEKGEFRETQHRHKLKDNNKMYQKETGVRLSTGFN